MSVNWYLKTNEGEYGPCDAGEITRRAASGKLKPNDMVRRERDGEWVPANRVMGLKFDEMTPAPSPPSYPLPIPAEVETPSATGASTISSRFWANITEHARQRIIPFLEHSFSVSLVVVAWSQREFVKIYIAMWCQFVRLVGWARAESELMWLKYREFEAKATFGEQLFTDGHGDPAIREQMAQLDRVIRDANTSRLDRWRHTRSKRRLAASLVDSQSGSADLGNEALVLFNASNNVVEQARRSAQQQRCRVWPQQKEEMYRVAAGIMGTALSLFALVAISISLSMGASQSTRHVVYGDLSPDSTRNTSSERELGTALQGGKESKGNSVDQSPVAVENRQDVNGKDRQPNDVALGLPRSDSPSPTRVRDLLGLLSAHGFKSLNEPYLEEFLRFGTKSEAEHAQIGDEFDVIRAERKAAEHRKDTETSTFLLRNMPIEIPDRPDFDEKGLYVTCRIPFRLHGVSTYETKRRELYSGSLRKLTVSRAEEYGSLWYFTKDSTLRMCQNAEEAAYVHRNNGILYVPDGRTSGISMRLSLSLDDAQSVANAPNDYSVDVAVTHLHRSAPTKWGFYRRDLLFKYDWDCDYIEGWNRTGTFNPPKAPYYFRIEASDQQPVISAHLIAAGLRDRERNTIASYGPIDRYGLPTPSSADVSASIRKLGNADLKHEDVNELLDTILRANPLPIKELARLLHSDSEYYRARAAIAFERLGKRGREAIPVLSKLVSDSDVWVRRNAIAALAGIGEPAEEAIAPMILALKDDSALVRQNAALGLAVVCGTKSTHIVPPLTASLEDPSWKVRAYSARSLGKLKAAAQSALPKLRVVQKDDHDEVRDAAMKAVEKIEGAIRIKS